MRHLSEVDGFALCGVESPRHWTEDIAEVNCIRCLRAKVRALDGVRCGPVHLLVYCPSGMAIACQGKNGKATTTDASQCTCVACLRALIFYMVSGYATVRDQSTKN